MALFDEPVDFAQPIVKGRRFRGARQQRLAGMLGQPAVSTLGQQFTYADFKRLAAQRPGSLQESAREFGRGAELFDARALELESQFRKNIEGRKFSTPEAAQEAVSGGTVAALRQKAEQARFFARAARLGSELYEGVTGGELGQELARRQKTIQAGQALAGTFESPIGAAGEALGLEAFREQAAAALVPSMMQAESTEIQALRLGPVTLEPRGLRPYATPTIGPGTTGAPELTATQRLVLASRGGRPGLGEAAKQIEASRRIRTPIAR